MPYSRSIFNKTIASWALVALFSIAPVHAIDRGAGFEGEVVGISDGDTISVLNNGVPQKVRLNRIDTPERSQAFGKQAKQFTSKLVFGQHVRVQVKNKDRYGRLIGEVYLPDGTNLNSTLVENGYAWWYREYAPRDNNLGELESRARADRVGMWSAAEPPLPPWQYRSAKRSRTAAIRDKNRK